MQTTLRSLTFETNNLINSKNTSKLKLNLEHKSLKEGTTSKKSQGKIANDEIRQVVEEFQESRFINKSFNFNIHEETNRIWVEIVDRLNNEVIKEIPSEKVLDLVAGSKDIIGLLMDEKV